MKFEKFNSVAFSVLLSAVFVSNIIFFNNSKYAVTENRELAKQPVFDLESFYSGKFSREVDDFLSDRFMFRDYIVRLTYGLKTIRGISYDGITLHTTKGFNDGGFL